MAATTVSMVSKDPWCGLERDCESPLLVPLRSSTVAGIHISIFTPGFYSNYKTIFLS